MNWTLERMESCWEGWKKQNGVGVPDRMDPGAKRVWVDALEGRILNPQGIRYRRTTGSLYCPGQDAHCCLGVLQSLGTRSRRREDWWLSGFLTKRAERASGVPAVVQKFLANCNDAGASFEVIASWIRKHL